MNPALGTCDAQWKVADALVRCWVSHKPKTIKNPKPILWSLHDLTCPYASRHIHIIQSYSVHFSPQEAPVISCHPLNILIHFVSPSPCCNLCQCCRWTSIDFLDWEILRSGLWCLCGCRFGLAANTGGLDGDRVVLSQFVAEMQCLGGLSSSSLGSSRAMVSGQLAALNQLKNDWNPQSRHSNKLPALKRKRVGLCTW